MSKKIIHIDGFGIFPDNFENKVGKERYFMDGWSGSFCRKTLKYSDEYKVEKWRTDTSINEIREHTVDNIVCKMFPAKAYGNRVSCPLILLELLRESQKNKILIHQHQCDDLHMSACSFFLRNTPIVVHDHGSMSAWHRYKKFKKKEYLILHHIQRYCIKYLDYYLCNPRGKLHFYYKALKSSKNSKPKFSLFRGGTEFEIMKPVNKLQARNKLGLPTESKIILYIGKYYERKGVSNLLQAYTKIKNEKEVILILLGGSEEDPLYTEAVETGAIVGNRHYDRDTELVLYYSATDVFVTPSFGIDADYSIGLGSAVVEALACGTPVVSRQLMHFNNFCDVKHVGLIPNSIEDYKKCINYVLENPSDFDNCREIAKDIFDWSVVMPYVLGIYSKLFNEYYKI